MTTLRVDAATIQELGGELRLLAGHLAGLEGARGLRRDIGHDTVSSALDDLLGNWTLARGQLARTLDDLGELAGEAGAAYLLVEQHVLDSLGCRPTACPAAGIPQ
ncbi:MAG: hypothetical protein GX344_07475 [Intrasporangiaceae bacterium]|nr:hypothetical protein [Intrasporangiaceae bacterium]